MLRLPSFVVVATILAASAHAQGGGGVIRGDVRSVETRLPLPYSTILLKGITGQFTDDSGVFSIPELASGTYQIVVRAIGYLPFDTTIVLGLAPVVLHVGLLPLAIELPPVTIVGRACIEPGPPVRDSEPELAAIFDQLRENAARYRLLSDSYPFRYWIERQVADSPPPPPSGSSRDRSVHPAIDTLERRSDARRPYKPGGLVFDQAGPQGRERTLQLPTVIDLADSIFHRSHCFSFAGVDTIDGRSQLRIDFLAAERLSTPDVAGDAWLDADTYELRKLVFRLTRPEKAMNSLQNLEVTVAFGNLLQSLPIPTRIEARSEGGKGRSAFKGHEQQRLIRVEFLKAPPGLAPRP